jgi:hypothetical protein
VEKQQESIENGQIFVVLSFDGNRKGDKSIPGEQPAAKGLQQNIRYGPLI